MREMDFNARDYTIAEWEDGWFVETADPNNIEQVVQVAGPFETKEEAGKWIFVRDVVTRK